MANCKILCVALSNPEVLQLLVAKLYVYVRHHKNSYSNLQKVSSNGHQCKVKINSIFVYHPILPVFSVKGTLLQRHKILMYETTMDCK